MSKSRSRSSDSDAELSIQTQYRLIEALSQTERKSSLRVENLREIVFETDEKGELTFVNQAWTTLLGYDKEASLGQPIADFICENDRTQFQKLFGQPRKGPSGNHKHTEICFKHQNGEPVWVEAAIVALEDETVIGSLYDITERKRAEAELRKARDVLEVHVKERTADLTEANKKLQCEIAERKRAEEALRQAEKRYRGLFEQAPLMYVITRNQNGFPIIVDCNEAFLNTLKYERSEVLNRPLADFYTSESRSKLLEDGGYQEALAGRFITQERQLLTKKGQVLDTLLRAVPETDAPGEVIGTRAMYVDITERRQAEKRLAESERFLRTIIDSEPECVKLLAADGTLLDMNRAGLDMIEANSLEQVQSKNVYPLIAPEYRKTFRELNERIFQGESGRLLFELVGLKGTRRWMETHAVPLRDHKDRVIADLAITRDITERKRAEEALRESKTRLQALFDNALDAILIADDKAQYIDVNPAACELTGYSREELLHMTVWDISPVPKHKTGAELWQAFIAVGQQSGEYSIRRKDGTTIEAEYRAVANFVPGLHLSVHRDITDRKQAEAGLKTRAQQQEVVATLGQQALSGSDLTTLMDETAQLVARTLDVEYCKVLELLPDGKALLLRSGTGWKTGYVGQAKIGGGLDSQAGYTLRSCNPIIVEDLHTETRFNGPPFLLEHKVISGMSVIIGKQNEPFGVLGAHTTKKRHFTQDDVNFLQAVANILASAIEQREAEKELRNRENDFRLLFANNPHPMWVYDLQTLRFLEVNEAAVSHYGYSRREFLKTKITNIHPQEDVPKLLEHLSQERPKFQNSGTWKHRLKSGQIIDVEIISHKIEFEDREAVLVVAQDITERKRAEVELNKLSSALRQTADTAVITDKEGVIQYVNPAFEKLTGYSRDEAIGQTPRILKSGKHDPQFYEELWQTILSVQVFRSVFINKKKNGTLYYADETITPVKDESGKITHFVSTGRDITEAKRTEEALKESEAKFRDLAEKSPNMIFINKMGRVVYVNEKCEEIMGYTKDEFYSPDFNFLDLIVPEYRNLVLENLQKHMNGEEIPSYEYAIITKQGKRLNALHTTRLIKYEGENAILGIVTDITERKRAEEALRQSEEKYRTILKNIEDGYYEVDLAGNFTFFNEAICEILGYDKNDLMGTNSRNYIDEATAKSLYQTFNRVFRTGKSDKGFLFELIRKDGNKRLIEASVSLIRNAQKKPTGFRGIARDITERKQLEEQLRQAQKMETLGTLVGGVAHDFNNLLTVIMGNLEFGFQNCNAEDPVRSDLIEIEQAAEQARSLIQQLTSFSRRQVLNPQRLNVNRAIEELYKMLKRVIGEDIVLKTSLGSELPSIWADPVQFQQVLMNICVNARDAMPHGGELRLVTCTRTANELANFPSLSGKANRFVEITIADTGGGMDSETQARIFEPFFTTKGIGAGTGLGLSVVYGIVKQHEGYIDVFSELGKGTTFKIYFPAVSQHEQHMQVTKDVQVVKGGAETILVVEDEDIVRKVATRLLKGFGYKVMTAKDGSEALQMFENKADDVNLVMMDVVLPGVSGPQTYKEMQISRPNLPVVFVTGYDLQADLDDIVHVDEKHVRVIAKPYSKETLGKTVRDVLDAHQFDGELN